MTCSRVVGPRRPGPAHLGITSITRVLVIVILIVMTDGPARAQSSGQRETASPSSPTAAEGSGDNPSTSIEQTAPNHQVTTPCSLRVPDPSSQPPPDPKAANVASVYVPLSTRCKFNLFLKQTYSPYTFASAGFQATEAQATGQWPHYGGGMQGWGKRFGATLANTESRRFIQGFALSTILRQDPRYFPSPNKTVFHRAWYAATRVVITKNNEGDSTFNTSEFLGALLASALQNSYYPRQDRTFGDTMNRFGGAISSDAIGDLLREFTPDMKRLFHKHAPKEVLKIEEKLPIPAEDKP